MHVLYALSIKVTVWKRRFYLIAKLYHPQVEPICTPKKKKCSKGVSVSFETSKGCRVSAFSPLLSYLTKYERASISVVTENQCTLYFE